MLNHSRSLTLAGVLLLGLAACGDDGDEGCSGIDRDGDGLVNKCGEPPPGYYDDSGTPGSRPGKDAGGSRKDAGGGDEDASTGDEDAGR